MPFLHSLLSPWDYMGFHAFFFTIFFLTKLHLQAAIPASASPRQHGCGAGEKGMLTNPMQQLQ